METSRSNENTLWFTTRCCGWHQPNLRLARAISLDPDWSSQREDPREGVSEDHFFSAPRGISDTIDILEEGVGNINICYDIVFSWAGSKTDRRCAMLIEVRIPEISVFFKVPKGLRGSSRWGVRFPGGGMPFAYPIFDTLGYRSTRSTNVITRTRRFLLTDMMRGEVDQNNCTTLIADSEKPPLLSWSSFLHTPSK